MEKERILFIVVVMKVYQKIQSIFNSIILIVKISMYVIRTKTIKRKLPSVIHAINLGSGVREKTNEGTHCWNGVSKAGRPKEVKRKAFHTLVRASNNKYD